MTLPTASLLDVNFLVALAWPNHVGHVSARSWFYEHRDNLFATCPITESGFVRISMNPLVVGEQVSVGAALQLLSDYQSKYAFTFWADDLPVAEALLPFRRISGHRQITDAYLLALAASKQGILVTFDGSIATWCPQEYRNHLCEAPHSP